MKRNIYILALLIGVLFVGANNAQAQIEVGTNTVNAGIGFGTYYNYGGGSATPVIFGSFDHGIAELGPGIVSIGGQLSWQHASYSYTAPFGYSSKNSYNTLFIGARGTWTPDILNEEKYNVYGGVVLGYAIVSAKYTSTINGVETDVDYAGGAASSLRLGLLVGGRYYFTDNIGAFAELGYDIAYLKLGLAVKF